MPKSILSEEHFHNEEAAYRFVEKRVWPDGPTCPKCGERERVSKMRGKSTRIGTYKCYKCRKPFTVKIGTIFESSHIPLHLWLQAIFLMASSKKGISANQLHRTLGVTLKSAWFLAHRIREAMRSGSFDPLGGTGKVVEADETYHGYREDDDGYKFTNERGWGPKKAGTLTARSSLLWSVAGPSAHSTSKRLIPTPFTRSSAKTSTVKLFS